MFFLLPMIVTSSSIADELKFELLECQFPKEQFPLCTKKKLHCTESKKQKAPQEVKFFKLEMLLYTYLCN